MKICIDQRQTTQPTGKHAYTTSLIKSLRALNHTVSIPQTSSGPTYYLSLKKLADQSHLLISPLSFIPPLLSSTLSITVIYDLSFTKKSFPTNKKATYIEKALFNSVIKKSKRIITISKAVQKELLSYSPHISSSLISPSIDINNATYKFPTQIPKEPYILFIGTLEPRKNITTLIDAHALAFKDSPNPPNLVLVGSLGWNYQHILDRIHENQHVIYLGRISQPQKDALLSHCTFLALPSLHEGFGLPVLEAMSHQKPSLISQDPALLEVAGKTGHPTSALDIHKMSQDLHRLYSQETYRHHLASHTLTQVKKYSPQNQQKQLFNLLNPS